MRIRPLLGSESPGAVSVNLLQTSIAMSAKKSQCIECVVQAVYRSCQRVRCHWLLSITLCLGSSALTMLPPTPALKKTSLKVTTYMLKVHRLDLAEQEIIMVYSNNQPEQAALSLTFLCLSGHNNGSLYKGADCPVKSVLSGTLSDQTKLVKPLHIEQEVY